MRDRYREMARLDSVVSVVLWTLITALSYFLLAEAIGIDDDIGGRLLSAMLLGLFTGAGHYWHYKHPPEPGQRRSPVFGAALLVGGLGILVAILVIWLVTR